MIRNLVRSPARQMQSSAASKALSSSVSISGIKLKPVSPWMAGSNARSRSAKLYNKTYATVATPAKPAAKVSNPNQGSSPTSAVLVFGLIALGAVSYYFQDELNARFNPPKEQIVEDKFTPSQVDAILSSGSSSLVFPNSSVLRCDTASVASSSSQDRSAQVSINLPGNRTAQLFVVLDGHGGEKCVEIVEKHLAAYVAKEVHDATNTWFAVPDRKAAIQTAIQKAFERLDKDIINGAFLDIYPSSYESVEDQKAKFASQIKQAVSGSCALAALVDGSDLYVAATGDTRAILGSRNEDGSFTATALSKDQRPDNAEERARILAEHPTESEADLLKPYTDPAYGPEDRVLGYIAITRAFGDAQFKWASDLIKKLPSGSTKMDIAGAVNPPYLTASPVVTHHTIVPQKDLFLVMATDGLTDDLNNNESVSIVNGFLQHHKVVSPGTNKVWGVDPFALGKWMLRQDTNAAGSLIRNAFGATYSNVSKRLEAPESRDDVTVKVLFFGDNRKEKEAVEGVDLDRLVETAVETEAPVLEALPIDWTPGPTKLEPVDFSLAKQKTHLLPRWAKWLSSNQ
ncbi:phosphatase 2C-like domain-containing protein [Obelidium mucronatum]|nr:phosphatase 2C-like domain-containing protein [Obelidium mucronatum]